MTQISNILVVSAHAADFCTRAGGTLLKYLSKGSKVTVFDLTFGERGESGNYWRSNPASTIQECKDRRKNEALEAAKLMGVKIKFFDYNDYPLEMNIDRIKVLIKEILEIRPNIILTHWIDDPFNLDHEITGKAVIRAVSSAGMLGSLPNTPAHFVSNIFFFESTVPHSEFNNFKIDTYIDITDVIDIKIEAIKKFVSQPQLVEYYTRSGLHRGYQASDWSRRPVKYAEGFKRYVPFVGTEFPLIEI
jgi:4-oxalomesaconate hydratase